MNPPGGMVPSLQTKTCLFCWLLCLLAPPGLFAESPASPLKNDAVLVEISAPSFVTTGQTFTATIVVRNTGTNIWIPGAAPYNLCSVNPQDNFLWHNPNRIEAVRYPIPPGDNATFTFHCRAPLSLGPLPFAWMMIEDGIERFGSIFQKTITVVGDESEILNRQRAWHHKDRNWQIEEGLPHNTVQALAQTADGYLWVGTQNGLARFDGVRFKVFNSGNAPEIRSSFISVLRESRDGGLWIGTFNGGLLHWKNGRFTSYSETDGLANHAIRSLFESADGSLWIGTTNGFSRMKDEKFQTLAPGNLGGHVVRAIAEDNAGSVWFGTSRGLFQFKDGILVKQWGGTDGLPTEVRALHLDQWGVLWIGLGGGLARIVDDRIAIFTGEDVLMDNIVNAVCEDAQGNICAGTYGGLSRISGGHWQGDNGSHDAIFALKKDREGNLWIGTKQGLFQSTVKPFTSYTRADGLTHNNVMSVREDHEGAMWIGTWGGGLNRLQNGSVTSYSGRNGLPTDLVLAICESRDGGLWVGSDFNGGLIRVEHEKITTWGEKEGLTDPAIRVLHEGREGDLWIGTSRALVIWKDGKFSRLTVEDGLPGATIRVLCEDAKDNLWIGTSGGLAMIKNAHHESRITSYTTRDGLPHNTVTALCHDASGDLWIGTAGGGLGRIKDAKSKSKNGDAANDESRITFRSYTSRDGLFSDDIFEIIEDDAGFFWMSSPKGVFRVSKKAMDDFDSQKIQGISCASYDRNDGLASIQCNGVAKPGAWKSKDGRIWFATTKGLAVMNPGLEIKTPTEPPPVVIEEILADKKSVESRVSSVGSQDNLRVTRHLSPVTVPAGRGELEFHYTALNFTAPEKTRFKYKLEGADPDWVETTGRRTAFYNNLPPGTYTFRVIAANSDGIWNSLGANVKLSLEPHYWQTWWFKSLLAITCLSLAAAGTRYATKRRMQVRLQRLEQEHAIEKERTRIAQDMHDELGARLSEILLVSDPARRDQSDLDGLRKMAGKIHGATRDLVDNLDAIVWAVNPMHDSVDGTLTYISDYAQTFLESCGIRCCVEAPGKLPPFPFSSETRHNLFMVVKEALNNVVKYANASTVSFHVEINEGLLALTIQDNGRGFSPANVSSCGNGLKNMEARTRKIGGSFELSSEPGKGTRIRLEIPL